MGTGAGGNPAGCPDTPPSVGLQCNFDMTASCNYPGETCVCRVAGAFNAWMCQSCPAVEPANGSACPQSASTFFSCPYGNDNCTCRTDGWYCRCNGCP